MKTIITIQHAQSEQHLNGMVGGWTDWNLTELGRKQADCIGRRLLKELGENPPFKAYTSDLKRVYQTADIALGHLGLQAERRKELREIYFGSATGKSNEWMEAHKLPREGLSNFDYRNLADAESERDVYQRISPFVTELEKSPEENFIVASHCCALTMFFARWLDLDPAQMEKSRFEGYAAGVSILKMDDAGRKYVASLNDRLYLADLL